jgi:drug/metabolite transporter (DMT)-like permease
MFTTGAMGTICYGIDLNFSQQKSHPLIYYNSLLWVGLPLSIASYLFTVGFKLASNAGKASTILVVGNAVIGFMMSFFRYDEGLNVFVLFGALIILGSVVVVVR